MPKKKKPSLLIKIWKIVIGAIDYFLVALVPPVIAIIGIVIGDENTIAKIPLGFWIALTAILIILAFTKGLQRYKEEANKANERKSYSKRQSTKVKSNKQRGGITADTVNIYGSNKKATSENAIEFPVVIPDKDGFDKLESAFPLWDQGVASQNKVKRYYLVLRNKGKVDTTSVHATVSFYDISCKELTSLSHEKAFWFNDKPRVQRSGNEIHIIKALSSPEGICLVIQNEGDKDLYIFSDDSYFPGTRNIVFNESLRIPVSEVYVCVELTAQNLRIDPVWLKIINVEKDRRPKFEILDGPPC